MLFGATPSLPWLGEEASEDLKREVSQLERRDPRETPSFDEVGDNDDNVDDDDDDDCVFVSAPSASNEARDAPPSYESVVNPWVPQTQPSDEDYQLPTYEEAVTDTVKKLQTETRV